jgi:hypothetical protein
MREKIQELRESYGLDENFDRRVVRRWMEGFAAAYTCSIHGLLQSSYGTQSNRAEVLALDRTTLTKKKNRALTADQVLWVFYLHPQDVLRILSCPATRENAVVAGYIKAMSWIQKKEINASNDREHETLTREKYECLYEVFCGSDWSAAVKKRDRRIIASVAERVLRQIHEEVDCEPELFTVEDVLRLIDEWFDAFWLCVVAIVEYVLPKPQATEA